MRSPALPAEADFVIVGAGIIGSSLAAELSKKGAQKIIVVDPDLEGSWSSTELNAGGVRATFHQEVNILTSKLSIEYFEKFADEVGYKPSGYLWLLDAEKKSKALQAQKKWDKLKWETQFWDLKKLTQDRPFIDLTEDLEGALFSPRDGLINPNLLKNHFRSIAKKNGVQFFDRKLLVGSSGMMLEFESYPLILDTNQKEKIFTNQSASQQKEKVRAQKVINCAGPWAAEVAKKLGYQSPSQAVRRQISFFDCRGVDLSAYGMIIDTSGVYFHSEATSILAGRAIREEPVGFNFKYDGDSFFEEHIWHPLSMRSTAFEKLRHLNGWSGLYEISPDESAIVGSVNDRIFESHSFSGHGVMHSYGAAVALAELLTLGRYETLDYESLSGSRFLTGKQIPETAVI